LHFTESLLAEIRSRGVQVCFVTLHVGLGTFAPVKAETIAGHTMHEERFELSDESARIINEAKRSGRRVIAVGTTSMRVLETAKSETSSPQRNAKNTKIREDRVSLRSSCSLAANPESEIRRPESHAAIQHPLSGNTQHATRNTQHALAPGSGKTRIFIHPPYDFKIADALLTNFHLPRSTLLMLVSAFAAPNEIRGRDLVLSAYAEAIRERYHFFSYGDAMLVV
jgi:S-adenosylmethionine:tRNA ribosyltransferase-isomerase